MVPIKKSTPKIRRVECEAWGGEDTDNDSGDFPRARQAQAGREITSGTSVRPLDHFSTRRACISRSLVFRRTA